jgi:hypothetical protein
MTNWTDEQLEAKLKNNASLRVANGERRTEPIQGKDVGKAEIVHPAKSREVLPVKKERKPRGPNKTELRFRDDIIAWRRSAGVVWEGLRLKLANGVIYVPDWVVFSATVEEEGWEPVQVTCFEVKGAFIRNPGRARTKYLVAKEQWPCFKFEAWQYLGKKDGWREIWK